MRNTIARYSALSELHGPSASYPGPTRLASLGAWPWLSYLAPSALRSLDSDFPASAHRGDAGEILSGLGLTKLTADELIRSVTAWAEKQGDILSVALVGSRARGDARSDSDVDFVIQCTRPARYLEEQTWISEFGVAQSVSIEDWGLVQSVRVFYANVPEVEYGITSPEWSTLPLDEGTLTVLRDGVVVLLDRDGSLTRAVEWMRELARHGPSLTS